LYNIMRENKEIRWSEIVRRALWDYVYEMQWKEKIVSDHDPDEKNNESKQQNLI
jgi:hypothetical protein